ncbi:MAG: glycosyltransferase family 2 protein [Bauldia sp.]|nr:glycosyltransferase family 2 protein [Bauldia sp.]MCW5777497.1 glycosyltransferase family 2 protein [Phycisphaeraceae bacterium]
MKLVNREGFREFNIRYRWWEGREDGISAAVRLRNEEEWVEPAIRSILPWCDEVVAALQCCTDRTEEVLRSIDDPKIRIVHYPFLSHPNGPGHDQHPDDSVYDRSYFYNWTLAQTRFSHALKWDGDMVAFDWLGIDLKLASARSDIVRFNGIDIVGPGLNLGVRHHTAMDPRLFLVTPETFYTQGARCEQFSARRLPSEALDMPAYLHFKWSKSRASATKSWPGGWESLEHFQKIMERSVPVAPYNGPLPAVLAGRFA